jgi:hypothetical protein
MIMPPTNLNDEVVAKALYLEHELAVEFPGYEFQVIDLRKIEPVAPNRTVQFGDGMHFAAIPLMGTAAAGPNDGGYICEPPSISLLEDIVRACSRFDLENPHRYAA